MSGQPSQTGNDKDHPTAESQTASSVEQAGESNSDPNDTSGNSGDEPFDWHAAIKRPERWLVIVGFITFGVVGWQAILMRQHAEHLGDVAEILDDTARRQLRAYLAVTIGLAVYQEKEKGVRFAAHPILTNTGQTPALKVRLQAKAAILPVPLPKETHLSEVGDDIGEAILAVRQSATMSGIVDGFCHDDEVEDIKAASRGRSLYVWGIINYEDVFGEQRYTRFCQQIHWFKDGTVHGYYTPGRNQAT